VETQLYEATVSNVGGVLRSFRLKEYLDAEGKPTELIEPYAGSKVGFPLAAVSADTELDALLSRAHFVFRENENPLRVVMEFRDGGIEVRKSLEFSPDKYLVTVSSRIVRNGSDVPHQIALQGDFGDHSIPSNPAKKFAVYRNGGGFTRVALPGITDPQSMTASMAGVEDQYFLAMFLARKDQPLKVGKVEYKLADLANGTEGALTRALQVTIEASEALQVYIGPKFEESLLQVNAGLGAVIDYGMFAIIARPCLVALRWLHGYIGNYGWAIIVLTFLINTILFPLRVKQQLSAQKMQKMAPQMRQLQDKYKKLKPGDPKRAEVEKELMDINKQQLSGCLPMLLQMPFLFAFLAMMTNAIELRGAPWILWVTDLSQPDHLYILPVLMGVAMFVQMKLSPAPPDPAQARMMMITPVLVTILFLWFQSASGLTLYWLTGNVIGIGQQWFIRRHWSDDTGKPRRPRRETPPA
jgi:YidC/Oxa1 family membrane protein insertase